MAIKVDELKKGTIVADPRDQSSGAYTDQGKIGEVADRNDIEISPSERKTEREVVLVVAGSQQSLISRQDFEANWEIVTDPKFPRM